jgi:hypothetical protein
MAQMGQRDFVERFRELEREVRDLRLREQGAASAALRRATFGGYAFSTLVSGIPGASIQRDVTLSFGGADDVLGRPPIAHITATDGYMRNDVQIDVGGWYMAVAQISAEFHYEPWRIKGGVRLSAHLSAEGSAAYVNGFAMSMRPLTYDDTDTVSVDPPTVERALPFQATVPAIFHAWPGFTFRPLVRATGYGGVLNYSSWSLPSSGDPGDSSGYGAPWSVELVQLTDESGDAGGGA